MDAKLFKTAAVALQTTIDTLRGSFDLIMWASAANGVRNQCQSLSAAGYGDLSEGFLEGWRQLVEANTRISGAKTNRLETQVAMVQLVLPYFESLQKQLAATAAEGATVA